MSQDATIGIASANAGLTSTTGVAFLILLIAHILQ